MTILTSRELSIIIVLHLILLVNCKNDVNGNIKSVETCPCKNAANCEPIAKVYEHEVFVFSMVEKNAMSYDYSRVTTIAATYGASVDPETVCYAHSHGTRLVFMANFPAENLRHPETFQPWIDKQLTTLKSRFLDGVNVDFESVIEKKDSASRDGLNMLMEMLTTQVKALNKNYQVTFDFAWSPHCIDIRCYDFYELAAIVDYVFIMAYDERSWIFDECIAWANSAYNNTLYGVEEYLKLGLPKNKVILGVPWYGYIYPCLSFNKQHSVCEIAKVPFRGVACSDAAGSEIDFFNIQENYLSKSSGRQWDPVAQSPYFTVIDQNDFSIRQIWYDDPESLSLKYSAAVSLNLAGVGMWHADSVTYNKTRPSWKLGKEMWQAIPFKKIN